MVDTIFILILKLSVVLVCNGLGYRQLAECGTRICRLSIGLLVKLIIFFLTLPLIGDEPLLPAVALANLFFFNFINLNFKFRRVNYYS